MSQEPGPIDRPDWFPQGPELDGLGAAPIRAPRRERRASTSATRSPHGRAARGRVTAGWHSAAEGARSPDAVHADVDVIDVDSHVYEPAAIWDDYVEPEYRRRARAAFWHGSTPTATELDDPERRSRPAS